MITEKIGNNIVLFLPADSVETAALQQIKNTASMPFLYRHVAVMPDAHYGKGSTVGTVLPTKGAIIPAAVGVDIGCGMIAVKTNIQKEDVLGKLRDLRAGIERRIPMSAGKNNKKITPSAQRRIDRLERMPGAASADELSPNWRYQLGTLGGGNHFIEVCLDEEDGVWATLHSGSRGVGNKIGMTYIKKARALCEKQSLPLPDRDLAYFLEGTSQFDNYIREMRWAQEFALSNREEMMDRFMEELARVVLGDHARAKELELRRINSHHNFTTQEEHMGSTAWVTRKGAIKADVDSWAMIPGSMGTRSYIVKGKANVMAFKSAPHGAGRRFSRTQARKQFTMNDFVRR